MSTRMQLAHGTRFDPDLDAKEIAGALDAILDSPPFRTSKQCQHLLSHVVELSLRGNLESLRERVLGVEVFGRAPNYNTSEDPVVRMRAADVRKRLAQYYQSADADAVHVLIDLPPGSYRAYFRPVQPHAAPAPDAPAVEANHASAGSLAVAGLPVESEPRAPVIRRKQRRPQMPLWSWLVLALAVLLAAAGLWQFRAAQMAAPASLQQRFWAPLTGGRQPIVIDVGTDMVYRFMPDYVRNYQKAHGATEYVPEAPVDLPAHGLVRTSDLVAVPNTFLSVGDLAGVTQLISLLNGWRKPYSLRSGSDVTIGDLRNAPAVLVGGFSNPWALELMKTLPLGMIEGDRIVDRADPKQVWKMVIESHSSATDDYALITRMPHSQMGGPLLLACGIGAYGTEAAGEFLGDAGRMHDLLRNAPAGWESKNMQFVLHVRVFAHKPTQVDVTATRYW